MPRYPIARSTNFIIEDESWSVIEYDHTSVPGTVYLSLTEDKINRYYDDTVENIADTNRRAIYEIIYPENLPHYSVGEPIIIDHYTLMKNGVPCSDVEVNFESTDKGIVKKVNGQLVAVGEGDVSLRLNLIGIDEPISPDTITITVGGTPARVDGYIDGPDYIRVSRAQLYEFVATDRAREGAIIPMNVIYSLGENSSGYALVREPTNEEDPNPNKNKCIIQTNNEGKLGTITLIALYEGYTYTKEIQIIPLWR